MAAAVRGVVGAGRAVTDGGDCDVNGRVVVAAAAVVENDDDDDDDDE